jgi:hypothetical protein
LRPYCCLAPLTASRLLLDCCYEPPPLRVWFLTLGLLAAAGLAMLVVFALGIDIRFLLL